ncbi:MAG: MMPL family transporter [Anaerolineales bacterium]
MYRKFAAFSFQKRWVVILAWVLLAVLMVAFAPPLEKVGITDQESFLPSGAPSVKAGKLIAEKFPKDSAIGDTIVFFRSVGLTDGDMAYAREVEQWLQSPSAPSEVSRVISVFSNPELEPMLKSADGTAMLMTVEFTTAVSAAPTHEAVDRIRAYLKGKPAGLEVYTAGSASVARDTLETVKRSLDRTTWATIALVVIILLVIYRSPVAALVPLATIGAAYLVSTGVLGFLAQAGVKMSTQMDIFAVVVIFGVGTDYCLFIVSRFREELHRQGTRFEAGVRTMEKIGAVIAASATVVILAFLFLNVASFGMSRTLGTGLAVCIFITLLAGLTLTPALLSVMGTRLFWPFANEAEHPERGFWHGLAHNVSRNAAWVVPLVIVCLLVPYAALPKMVRSFDILADVPKDLDSAKGFETLKGHFDPGEIFPTHVMLLAKDGDVTDELATLDAVVQEVQKIPGVLRVRSLLTPTGETGQAVPFTVDAQLTLLADGLRNAATAFVGGQGSGAGGADPATLVAAMNAYLQQLAETYPDVKAQPAYTDAVASAKALQNQLARLEQKMRVTGQLETIAEQVGMLATGLRSPMLTAAPESLAQYASMLQTLKQYLAGLGDAYPFVKGEASYAKALAALDEISAAWAQAQRGLLVSGQLDIIADSLDALAKQLDNPASLMQVDTASQLTALQSYMGELAERYPWVVGEPAFAAAGERLAQMAQAAAKLKGGQVALSDLPAALSALKAEVTGMAEAMRTLAGSFASRDPKASFVPKNLPGGLMRPADLAGKVEEFGLSLLELRGAFEAKAPDARYVAAGLSGAAGEDVTALAATVKSLASNLDALRRGFEGKKAYLYPKALFAAIPAAQALEKAFVSEDRTATRLYVILEPEPYSNAALDLSQRVRKAVGQAVEGTGSEVYITGSSVAFADIRQVSNEDFIKVLVLIAIGVFVVMIALLRSVVAPTYLVLTVLLSYGSTLGLTVFVFQMLMGQEGVNLLIPTIVLVLLVALGADYNIFLMSRVREETASAEFVEGLVAATSRTGAIITSCGIVLAGTFATMMLSPMTMLFQVGASVAFGVLLDTFVIRGILVPGIARLLRERNWWPSKR